MEKASCWGWIYLSSVGIGKVSHLIDCGPSSAPPYPQVLHTSLNGLKFLFLPGHTWDASAGCVGAGGHSIHLRWEGVSHARGQAQKTPGECGRGTDLGLYMVGHVVGCAAQWDLPDRPRSIIGQVGRQDADPQLTLEVPWAAKSVLSGVNKARANEPRPPQMFSSSGDGISGLLCWVVPGEAKALVA